MKLSRKFAVGLMTASLAGGTLVLNAPSAGAAPKVKCTKNIKNTWGAGTCSNYGPGSVKVRHVFDCSWQADLRSGWTGVGAGLWVKNWAECRFSMRDISAQLS